MAAIDRKGRKNNKINALHKLKACFDWFCKLTFPFLVVSGEGNGDLHLLVERGCGVGLLVGGGGGEEHMRWDDVALDDGLVHGLKVLQQKAKSKSSFDFSPWITPTSMQHECTLTLYEESTGTKNV